MLWNTSSSWPFAEILGVVKTSVKKDVNGWRLRSTSSLVCADFCLNISFSFTRDSSNGFLLRHNFPSYVVYAHTNTHTHSVTNQWKTSVWLRLTTWKAQSGWRWPWKAQSGQRRPLEKLSLVDGWRSTSGCAFHHARNFSCGEWHFQYYFRGGGGPGVGRGVGWGWGSKKDPKG